MLAADHISAVKRSFESRAMPETEKPPARLVDIYSMLDHNAVYFVPRPEPFFSIYPCSTNFLIMDKTFDLLN